MPSADQLDIPDFSSMSSDEVVAWFLEEPELEPVSAFPLESCAGRKAFLQQFYDIGETALFEAVSHVWESLAEPKANRCTAMGAAAATGGTGKPALTKVLRKFFAQAMAIDNPLPQRAEFLSIEEWHQASMATFDKDQEDLQILLTEYSEILNGGPEKDEESAILGTVIIGPWKAAPPTPDETKKKAPKT